MYGKQNTRSFPSQVQDSVNIHNNRAIWARLPRHMGFLKYSYRQIHYMPRERNYLENDVA
jgi:hypothetical protein